MRKLEIQIHSITLLLAFIKSNCIQTKNKSKTYIDGDGRCEILVVPIATEAEEFFLVEMNLHITEYFFRDFLQLLRRLPHI